MRYTQSFINCKFSLALTCFATVSELEVTLLEAVGFTSEVVTDLLLLAPSMSPKTPIPVKSAMGAAAGGKEAAKAKAEADADDGDVALVLTAEVGGGLDFEAVAGRAGGAGDGAEAAGAASTTAAGLVSKAATASVPNA